MNIRPYHAKMRASVLHLSKDKPKVWRPGESHTVKVVEKPKVQPEGSGTGSHSNSHQHVKSHGQHLHRNIPRSVSPSPHVQTHHQRHDLPRHQDSGITAPAGGQTESQQAKGVFAALIPEIQRAVREEGYAEPTPIQAQTILHVLVGSDILGCAQTGTGKTAAFVLPILQYLAKNHRQPVSRMPRVLILAPTRELAAQIGNSIKTYGRYLRSRHTVIFGGVGQYPQVEAIRNGVDILVATPGRLLDLMNQRHVRLNGVEVFVLDEADRMLDMGFIPDIRKVLAALPAKSQSLFFSATLTPNAIQLARTMVHDAVHITVTPEQPTVEKIVQKIMFIEKNDKDALLVRLLRDASINKVLVFTRMKHLADRVVRKLHDEGIPAAAIHADKSQAHRTRALEGFKSGRIRVLVATDIAARGIDVDRITHVINYSLPNEAETYIHRIGRTARAGAEGDAISFCSPEDRNFLRDIERLIRKQIPVDFDHPYHSESARNATGAAARPPPRQQHAHARRPGGHHGHDRQSRGGRR